MLAGLTRHSSGGLFSATPEQLWSIEVRKREKKTERKKPTIYLQYEEFSFKVLERTNSHDENLDKNLSMIKGVKRRKILLLLLIQQNR